MSGETADRLVAEVSAHQPSSVLDIGCGWAELLLRILRACPGAVGHGIDHEHRHIERARQNAKQRSLLDRLSFATTLADCEPHDLVLCVGSEHVIGSRSEALRSIRPLVRPGGRAVFGTLFWQEQPLPHVLEDFGELPELEQLISQIVDLDWIVERRSVASFSDWDTFEYGFAADWEVEPGRISDQAEKYRAAYLERRGVLGFVNLTLTRSDG